MKNVAIRSGGNKTIRGKDKIRPRESENFKQETRRIKEN